MTFPPWAKVAYKWALLITTVVSGLGSIVSDFGGFVPSQWLAVAMHVVTLAGAVHLYLVSSPLLQPLLETKSPETVIAAAKERQAREASAEVVP